MVESMTATAERIADYEMLYGKDEVERFLDAVLGIQEHIDPSIRRHQLPEDILEEEEVARKTPYDDLWNLGLQQTDKKKKESCCA